MTQKSRVISLDILQEKRHIAEFVSFPQIQKNKDYPSRVSPVLFSRGKVSTMFFTDDSARYLTFRELKLQKEGYRVRHPQKSFDCVRLKYQKVDVKWEVKRYVLKKELERSYAEVKDYLRNISDTLALSAAPQRMWKFSMVSSVLVGMVSMSMIYRYLGEHVSASNTASPNQIESSSVREAELAIQPEVLGVNTEVSAPEEPIDENSFDKIFAELESEQAEKDKLEQEIREMVKGYPIEKMIPRIMEKDKKVAAFMVSIAKKESNWGKRVPVLDGQDCFNYWGYRGKRQFMGTGGHTCFNSREDAVDTVAKRIETLVEKNNLDTPSKMIVWKCGSTCAGHSDYSVKKWISDVKGYYDELNN